MTSVINKLQPVINSITTWADQNGFNFSRDKTACMVFHPSPSYVVKPTLKLHNNNIAVKQTIKFLGLH